MEESKAPSPNGKYLFRISPWEARMSLWIESPRLIDTTTDHDLLNLNSNWSLDSAEWLDEEHVEMQLRRYPGDHIPSSFKVVIDCLQKEAVLGDANRVGLESLETALEELYHRSQSRPASVAKSSWLGRLWASINPNKSKAT